MPSQPHEPHCPAFPSLAASTAAVTMCFAASLPKRAMKSATKASLAFSQARRSGVSASRRGTISRSDSEHPCPGATRPVNQIAAVAQGRVGQIENDRQPPLHEGIAPQSAVRHHDDLRRSQRFIKRQLAVPQKTDSRVAFCHRCVGSKTFGRDEGARWPTPGRVVRRRRKNASAIAKHCCSLTGFVPSRTTGLSAAKPSFVLASAGVAVNSRVRRGHPATMISARCSPPAINCRRCISPQHRILSARTGI